MRYLVLKIPPWVCVDKALVTVGKINLVCCTGVIYSRFSGERGAPDRDSSF